MPLAGDLIKTSLWLPDGKYGDVFVVDPVNGDDANVPGDTFEKPYKTLQTAYAACADAQNDVILFVPGATADNPTASITWSKNYTHLIGLSGDLPGMGQRCRVVGTAALDLTPIITFSGAGCIVRNIQFFNGKDANTDSGAVIVSGSRNYFKNCFFAGMGHATPAARAGSYSLNVSGAENAFEDCTIGLDTIIRAAANAELIVSAERNRFIHCDIRSYSETAGKFLVKIDATADLRDIQFEECLFFNYSVNWATGITNAFNVPAGSTHYVILRGWNDFVGVGLGIADTVTHVYGAGPAPNAGMFIATNPTT